MGDPGSKDITSGSFLSSGFINILEKGDSLSRVSEFSSFLRVLQDLSTILRVADFRGGDISIISGSAGADLFRL